MKKISLYFLSALLFCNYVFSSQEKICFLHIPKTGGITVSSLLLDHYHIIEAEGDAPLIYAYGNHEFYYSLKKLAHGYKMVTFLRDPVQRVLSEQRYCIEKHLGDPKYLEWHHLPEIGDPIDTAFNVVCKMLSALNPQDPEISIEEHLKSAKDVLAHEFFFIGITEKMTESVILLYASLGWEAPEEIPFHNKTDPDRKYPQELIEAIAKRNWADIELYQFALKLYERQKTEIGNKAACLKKNQNYVDRSFYTFDQALKGSGWCPREAFEGVVFRWISEKNKASLDFYLKAGSNYQLYCSVLIQPRFANQLRLSVNGAPIQVLFSLPSNMTTGPFDYTKIG